MGIFYRSWCPLLIVVASAFTSLPAAYYLNKTDFVKDERLVFFAGVVCLLLALILPSLCISYFFRNVDPLIYACSLFCWTSVLDIVIAIELDEYCSGFMSFYIAKGEAYLQTSYGTLINYWDGTGHFAMYLYMIVLFCHRHSYREVGLYWIGSIVNSMLVFLSASLTGPFNIKWSYLLNMPYLIVPVLACFQFMRKRPVYIKSYKIIPSILRRPIDLMFVMYFIAAGAIALIRGLAVLGCKSPLMSYYLASVEPYLNDPNNYPKMQMLCYMYYYMFYYLCAIYGMVYLKEGWLADWALVHAGASTQAQFVHILASLHSRTPRYLQNPTTGLGSVIFITINLALLVVPQLFAWRCVNDPEHCGRVYAVEISEPRYLTEYHWRNRMKIN